MKSFDNVDLFLLLFAQDHGVAVSLPEGHSAVPAKWIELHVFLGIFHKSFDVLDLITDPTHKLLDNTIHQGC
ncbi:unnamed protein product [Tuber melanosporum]|uniref:(Perigord truffle) hypothetical protein n=1 Tax=Tuber melanosporum (strain Mel28) TaxID=656061 RepID=D5GCF7_TUBMM|nr:uncharacterized protein GSTUM_00005869001 [Tuber melanosporum]KAG0127029.1 hypothetical protein HOY82DRAFT_580791 [Tuber indicum]CAZ82200.1 unnamed protein product [Tuber melanosporum]